jgi:hypothetical protein
MDIAKLIAGVGAAAVSIGVLYNFGYFNHHLNFFALLSYKDHLTTLVFFAAPCLFFALLFSALRGPRLDKWMVVWIVVVIAAWSGTDEISGTPTFQAIVYLFIGVSSFFLVAYLTAVVFDFATSGALGTSGSLAQKLIGPAVAGLIVFIIMLGSSRYRADASGSHFDTLVTISADDKTPAKPEAARLVRVVEDGIFLIFKDEPGRIVFVRKEAVKMVSEEARG